MKKHLLFCTALAIGMGGQQVRAMSRSLEDSRALLLNSISFALFGLALCCLAHTGMYCYSSYKREQRLDYDNIQENCRKEHVTQQLAHGFLKSLMSGNKENIQQYYLASSVLITQSNILELNAYYQEITPLALSNDE